MLRQVIIKNLRLPLVIAVARHPPLGAAHNRRRVGVIQFAIFKETI